MDGILNFTDICFAYGSFSDCDGQHDRPIPEKIIGRQQKMKKSEKNLAGASGGGYDHRRWVEMKNRGLIIGRI